tara:strand:- start:3983 stop:4486 length:504 start_codon:yes stop_codon:yes gene_type:complete
MNPDDLMKLINDYYRDPNSFSDEEAEVIASLTRQLGMPFERERKPLRKFLYGAGEMATFGLLPDSWEPHSRGQDVYGETAIDAIASGAGSLLGLAGGVTGAYKGARGLFRSDAARRAGGKVVDAGKTFRDMTGADRALANVRGRMGRRVNPYIDSFFDRSVGNVGYY